MPTRFARSAAGPGVTPSARVTASGARPGPGSAGSRTAPASRVAGGLDAQRDLGALGEGPLPGGAGVGEERAATKRLDGPEARGIEAGLGEERRPVGRVAGRPRRRCRPAAAPRKATSRPRRSSDHAAHAGLRSGRVARAARGAARAAPSSRAVRYQNRTAGGAPMASGPSVSGRAVVATTIVQVVAVDREARGRLVRAVGVAEADEQLRAIDQAPRATSRTAPGDDPGVRGQSREHQQPKTPANTRPPQKDRARPSPSVAPAAATMLGRRRLARRQRRRQRIAARQRRRHRQRRRRPRSRILLQAPQDRRAPPPGRDPSTIDEGLVGGPSRAAASDRRASPRRRRAGP